MMVMKVFFFLVCTTVFCFNTEKSFSQGKVIIEEDQYVTADKVFRIIGEQTNYNFIYPKEFFKDLPKFQLKKGEFTVSELLDQILRRNNLDFSLGNNTILITESTLVKELRQQYQVTGSVKDKQGIPLAGANIIEKGTSNGVVADFDGNFTMEVSRPDAVLSFSFIGYETKDVPVGQNTEIKVQLAEDAQGLEEIVVIGYGTVRKSDLTGSVSQVKSKDINAFPASNVLQAVSGRAAGVQVIQNNGSPGSPISVRIRGTNSVQGGNDPLYVVDGFPFSGNPTQLNNSDIESIEVLKDASATAIYGSRGANGVVLITTKQGKEGKTRIDIETSTSMQSLRKKLSLMNAREYARFQNLQAANDNIPLYFTDQQINSYSEGYDWQDLIFQDAPIISTSLNVSGGNSKTRFSLAGGFFGQEGIIKGSDYNRYSLRLNLDHNISEKISVNFNTTLTHLKTERKDSGGGHRGNSMIGAALSAAPISQPYDENGNYTVLGNEFPFVAPDIINPLNFINELSNVTKANVVLSRLAFTYQPIEELTLKVAGGIENRDDRSDGYRSRNFYNSEGIAGVSTGQFRSLLSETTLAYNKVFGEKHRFSALAGFTYQDFVKTTLSASGVGFLSDEFETHNLGAAQNHNVPGSSYSKSVLLSYLGRINYTYSDRYLFTFSFRTDGSSRYSPGNKWGYFPSGAVAWKLSEEEFLKDNSLISDLKIRGSWGLTGSQAISPYTTLNQLSPGNTVFDDQLVNTFAPGSSLPGDLKWETTEQFDLGLDLGLWEGRMVFNADFYVKNTRDLLNVVRLPSSLGFTSTVQNVGKVQNKGIELGLDTRILSGSMFEWDLFGNISFNRNKVVSLYNGEDILGASINVLVVGDNATILKEGRPIGQFWGFKEDGYDEGGRIKFQDLDGDGKITANDKTYIGDPNPKFIYGLNSSMRYKNFELTLFIQGSQGNDILNVSSIPSTLDYGQGMNMPKEVLYDHWTPENQNAKYPLISRNVSARMSDRFVEDGSYLRFKNIQLAYNLPAGISEKAGFRNIQMYVSAQNYITFTRYSWWDPEVNSRGAGTQLGIDHYSYPIPKSLTVGLRLGL
ncbi:TonB-dependent receptor [Sinomicrobium pectinilyticum]|nr:TonB-dependent receptor [Sinomicrobium pectinilyticum]